jgi:hypothetical protein
MERRGDHDQRSVMGLVIERLYFGKRPNPKDLAANGSILRQWHAKGYDWPTLARVVEGLAIRRDQGELRSVDRNEPVSLRWIQDKDQLLNQAAVCLDAVHRQVKPVEEKRGGAITGIGDLLNRLAKGA